MAKLRQYCAVLEVALDQERRSLDFVHLELVLVDIDQLASLRDALFFDTLLQIIYHCIKVFLAFIQDPDALIGACDVVQNHDDQIPVDNFPTARPKL